VLADVASIGKNDMPPIYEDLRPTLRPWERPQPVFRDVRGRFLPGSTANRRGRPSASVVAAKLATRAANRDGYERMKRVASYEGITPEQFVRVARAAYGKSWQAPLAADLMMSRQGIIRWAKGKYRISGKKETLLLLLCLRRVRAAHALVRAMYRRAVAAESARQQLAATPRYKPLTR
jgi:hypothetical protein